MIPNSKDHSCPDNSYPHAVIIDCFWAFFRQCMSDDNQVDIDKLDEGLSTLLNLKLYWPELIVSQENYESYYVFGCWAPSMLAAEEVPSNGIPEFVKGSRYIAYIISSEWGYWEDDTPYDFPAVAYSPDEIHAWFVWALKKCMRFFPDHKERLTELMECHADVDVALALLQKKLNGEIPWEFGPARIREPKMILWHERTKDKKMNDWIRQWLV